MVVPWALTMSMGGLAGGHVLVPAQAWPLPLPCLEQEALPRSPATQSLQEVAPSISIQQLMKLEASRTAARAHAPLTASSAACLLGHLWMWALLQRRWHLIPVPSHFPTTTPPPIPSLPLEGELDLVTLF